MKFRELRLFARTDGGGILLPEGVRALNLPMPEDVLEQFVLDHGINASFQARYGDVNLYALSWSQEQLETTDILSCTTKFDNYVLEISERHSAAKTVDDAVLHREARPFWSEHGTWSRAPIFFRDVLPPPDHHHLVEGHTRLGALMGFHRGLHPPVQLSATHTCWVGRPSVQPITTDWRTVRRQYPLSFKQWIYEAIDQEDSISPVASALLNAEHRSRYTISVGDELPDLIRLIEHVPVRGLSAQILKKLHTRWTQQIGT